MIYGEQEEEWQANYDRKCSLCPRYEKQFAKSWSTNSKGIANSDER